MKDINGGLINSTHVPLSIKTYATTYNVLLDLSWTIMSKLTRVLLIIIDFCMGNNTWLSETITYKIDRD